MKSFPEQVVTKEAIVKLPSDTGPGSSPSDNETPVVPAPPPLGDSPQPPSASAPAGTDVLPKFCSPLNFEGLSWNPKFTLEERRSFAIALSISGGFEGSAGWQNITTNSDGQGLSAGLLNQTLGTGSLQPLLATYQTHQPRLFSSAFSPSHLSSVSGMLENWKQQTNWHQEKMLIVSAALPNRDRDQTFNTEALTAKAYSNEAPIISAVSQLLQSSVSWAKKNLYLSTGQFIPSWKSELQSLLIQPGYVSLQVEAAEHYHMKALTYVNRVKVYDLRTYLLMFDFVTQNGSISEARFAEWEHLRASSAALSRTT